MPPIDSLFLNPYKWSLKDAHGGNVKRALAGRKAVAHFNGHSHRGGDNKGGYGLR